MGLESNGEVGWNINTMEILASHSNSKRKSDLYNGLPYIGADFLKQVKDRIPTLRMDLKLEAKTSQ